MDSSSASVTSPAMSKESPGNEVEEEALRSKEIIDQSQSSEGVNNHESSLSESVRASPPPKATPPLSRSSENPLPPPPPPLSPPVAEEEEREYGCKYCNKKFSNKQALGGHQNAHKLERTIEKNIQEGRASNFGFMPGGGGGTSFFPGMNSPPRNNFNGSVFNRSQEFFNRAIMNMRYFPQQGAMQHGMTHRYPGCPRPVSGNVSPAHPGLETRPPGIRFSTPRRGTSSSFPQPVPDRNFLEESRNVQMNGQDNQQVEDDSGLDLSLKL
ncbi:zinc finger protein 3-like [Abeliophyllum distichum]|uniref:Zinc finger protein 3-like n=1 Tax=Abeliophyllum distichum TaxID=126358 RepID=A0ABD1QX68_9LAMI